MTVKIELEREQDSRWIAEIPDLSGVLCYGANEPEAVARVQALALRVLAERREHEERPVSSTVRHRSKKLALASVR